MMKQFEKKNYKFGVSKEKHCYVCDEDVELSRVKICQMPGYSSTIQYQEFKWIDCTIEKFKKLSPVDIIIQICDKDMDTIKNLMDALKKDRTIGLCYSSTEDDYYTYVIAITGVYLGCSAKNVLPALRIDGVIDVSVQPGISARMAASLKRHNSMPYISTLSENQSMVVYDFGPTIKSDILSIIGKCCMPTIKRVIINDPGVVVFWSDGTKTVGKCMPNDIFDPEIGLAMAISRKYYEVIGVDNPRAAFKNQLKSAENQSERTKQKKNAKIEYKKQKEIYTND